MHRVRGSVTAQKRIMTKRWIRAALLDPWNDILLRIESIQTVSTVIDAIPETHFTLEEQSLIQEQRRLPTVQTLSDIISKNDQLLSRDVLLTFATSLDQIHSYKMVHWDVKPANICFDGEQLYLVDWEPSLVQVRKGRTTMVVSPEFMAPSERHSVGPTALSDRFGWIKSNRQFFPRSKRSRFLKETVIRSATVMAMLL